MGDILKHFAELAAKEGAFAFGTVFGCFITATMYWMASRERSERLKSDVERETLLVGQLKQKDDRINELHKMLEGKAQQLLPEQEKRKEKPK